MAQKVNRQPRLRKRLAVRFGPTPELANSGFTLNLSARGLAIATQYVAGMQKHLFFEVTNGEERFKAEGIVVWAQRGVIISGVPSSMGIRLTWAEDRYFNLLAELSGTKPAAAPPVSTSAPPPARVDPGAHRVAAGRAPPPPEPDEDQEPQFQDVAINGGEVTESLPDFMTMLLDSASDEAPTPVEVQPLRDRVDRAPRFMERLQVEFGPGVLLCRQGMTLNVSETGLAVAASEPIEPGEMVVFTVRGRDGSVGRGAGVVTWAYSGNAQSHHAAAIGIRLTLADSKYRRILGRVSLGL